MLEFHGLNEKKKKHILTIKKHPQCNQGAYITVHYTDVQSKGLFNFRRLGKGFPWRQFHWRNHGMFTKKRKKQNKQKPLQRWREYLLLGKHYLQLHMILSTEN